MQTDTRVESEFSFDRRSCTLANDTAVQLGCTRAPLTPLDSLKSGNIHRALSVRSAEPLVRFIYIYIFFNKNIRYAAVSPLSGFSKPVEHARDPLDQAVPLPDDAITVEDEHVRLRATVQQCNIQRGRHRLHVSLPLFLRRLYFDTVLCRVRRKPRLFWWSAQVCRRLSLHFMTVARCGQRKSQRIVNLYRRIHA